VSKINLEDGGKNAKPMRTLLVVNSAHPENGWVHLKDYRLYYLSIIFGQAVALNL